MLLREALKKLKYDRRLQEYNIDKGILSQEELQSHIDGLTDSQASAEPLRFREERRSSEDRPTQRTSQAQQPSYDSQGNQGHSGYGFGASNSFGSSDDNDSY